MKTGWKFRHGFLSGQRRPENHKFQRELTSLFGPKIPLFLAGFSKCAWFWRHCWGRGPKGISTLCVGHEHANGATEIAKCDQKIHSLSLFHTNAYNNYWRWPTHRTNDCDHSASPTGTFFQLNANYTTRVGQNNRFCCVVLFTNQILSWCKSVKQFIFFSSWLIIKLVALLLVYY